MWLRSLPWSTALRAGFVAYAATTLTVALLLSSYWAGQTNFPGHHHPEGTPEHSHSIFQVAGAATMPAATVVAQLFVLLAFFGPFARSVWRGSGRSSGAVLARAPPRRASPRHRRNATRTACATFANACLN